MAESSSFQVLASSIFGYNFEIDLECVFERLICDTSTFCMQTPRLRGDFVSSVVFGVL